MRIARRFTFLINVILFGSAIVSFVQAQQPVTTPTPKPVIVNPQTTPTPKPPSLERHFLKNIALDQMAIWLSPFKLREKDLKWLLPFAVTETGLILSDRETSSWVQRSGSLPLSSHAASIAGKFYVTGGVASGFYLIGKASNNQHAQETGALAAEALVDSSIVTEVLKLATQRERPDSGTGQGRFFTHGSSFPSGHASGAWSVATVIAYEYQDHPLIKYGAFAAAAAISLSRYSGRNHFLSDVLAGSAIGFGVGRFVYKNRHIQISNTPDKGPSGTAHAFPLIMPLYDRRTSTYGARLVWNF